MDLSTLVQFSKLVSDSTTSEGIFLLLGETVVKQCHGAHSLVFGTGDTGDFRLLASFGDCDETQIGRLDLEGVCSIAELRSAVMDVCSSRGYGFRAFPLISEAGLFGALVVLYSETEPPAANEWVLIDGLTELTAISLGKTYQHQKLQKAFDDLRTSQDTLVRTERLRALGEMSAGIAHDLRNIFNPLMVYSDLIREAAGNRDEVVVISTRIDRILTRGLETVERLRDFSRQSPVDDEAVPADLNALVGEAVEIVRSRLEKIDLVLQLTAVPPVLIRPADGVTAVVNLALNAVDALQGRGRIYIATGTADDGVWVEVADNGPGIPPEIKDRILEPFFTTKGNLGTGLGVSIVYAFTERHGGRLQIESEAGQGAKFRMWFPAITEQRPQS